MGIFTEKSPTETSSAFSLAPPTQGQAQPLPQSSGAGQSLLLQGLSNYLKSGTNAAGNPNATPPSLGSSLMQGIGNGLDNSTSGQLINSISGNAAGNGYGNQLMQQLPNMPPDWLQSILGTASTGNGMPPAAGAASDTGAGDAAASSDSGGWLSSLFS